MEVSDEKVRVLHVINYPCPGVDHYYRAIVEYQGKIYYGVLYCTGEDMEFCSKFSQWELLKQFGSLEEAVDWAEKEFKDLIRCW